MCNNDPKTIYISKKISSYYKQKHKQKITEKLRKDRLSNYYHGGFSKIYECITKRIQIAFTRYNIPLNLSYETILNCTTSVLEKYIADKLKEGMTIENHGEWEIDHIVPISSFNFDNKDNVTNDNIIKCFNYTNLQPLWLNENRVKSDKIV